MFTAVTTPSTGLARVDRFSVSWASATEPWAVATDALSVAIVDGSAAATLVE
jgi:hypothetical protein